MEPAKRAALEKAGFEFTTVGDLLGLTEDERKLLEFRVRLARRIREARSASGLTQRQLAASLKTTQPRVAKIERAAGDVSLDQMLRCFYLAGGSDADLFAGDASGEAAARSKPSRVLVANPKS